MASPRVTVLITYYNKGPYIEEAVRSVLDGTYQDFEILIVDDGSTDGGLERLRAMDDRRIRILESAVNTGRAAAANRGFDAALGEYIAVLDADDRMTSYRLAHQVALMDADPGIGVSSGFMRTFGEAEIVFWTPERDAEARAMVLFGMPVYYGACIIRRSVLQASGVRCDPHWRTPGMDYIFMHRLIRHTRIANLPEVLTEYRRGDQNMRHGRDHSMDRLLIIRELFRVIDLSVNDGGPELLLALEGRSPAPLDATTVKAIHSWLRRLRVQNKQHAWFDPQALEVHISKRWDRLFHDLPDRDPKAAWIHAILTRPLPLGRLRYLLLMRVKRALGFASPGQP